MTSNIHFTVGDYFMVPCPKCEKGHFLHDWGKQKCQYEGCDGHEWNVDLTPDIAVKMLEEIEKQKKIEEQRRKEKSISKWTPPRLQKIFNGWIAVPQV